MMMIVHLMRFIINKFFMKKGVLFWASDKLLKEITISGKYYFS